jgi:hypothetical protein
VRGVLAAALCAVALVAVYAGLGGGDQAPTPPPDPCAIEAESAGDGAVGTLERLGLNALAGGACELGVSRERLLLALAGDAELEVGREQRDEAFRAGLREAIAEEERAGRLGATEAFLLRQAVGFLPIGAVLDRVFGGGGDGDGG